MTLTSDLIEQTRLYLHADSRPERNKLNDALDASTTSFELRYDPRATRSGATLGVGLEEMHVWQTSGNAVTVERGDAGSTAATHAAGATVWVDRFTPWRIFTALNDELRSLSSRGLYQARTLSLGFAAYGEYSLSTATDFLGIVNVQEDPATPDYPRTLGRGTWRLQRATNSGTNTLAVLDAIHPASDLIVTYRSEFGTLTALTDNVTTVTGLWDEAHDILPLGAAIRLLTGTEAARNDLTQGDTRRADEVPPGARTGALRPLMLLRDQRLRDEALRLRAQYPEQVR